MSLHRELEDFEVSSQTGFLSPQLKLQSLPAQYSAWQDIVENLPSLIKNGRLRLEIRKLSVLGISGLGQHDQWQRAYVMLSFLAQAYIWETKPPSDLLPAAISYPLKEVAEYLELPPVATYTAVILWNFFSGTTNQRLHSPENVNILYTFTGTQDEEWFYAISIAIEARGAAILPVILKTTNSITSQDTSAVEIGLADLTACVLDIIGLLRTMHKSCDPDIFYNQIRPFLSGTSNMAGTDLPYGVFYEEVGCTGQWRKYSGASNAQSTLIQLFDIALGVQHRDKETRVDEDRGSFQSDMRHYMPGPHRRLLEYVASLPNIPSFVKSHAPHHSVHKAFKATISSLVLLRNSHLQLVTRYIITPARKAQLQSVTSGSLSKAEHAQELIGTGGTQLVSFLKQSRDNTIHALSLV